MTETLQTLGQSVWTHPSAVHAKTPFTKYRPFLMQIPPLVIMFTEYPGHRPIRSSAMLITRDVQYGHQSTGLDLNGPFPIGGRSWRRPFALVTVASGGDGLKLPRFFTRACEPIWPSGKALGWQADGPSSSRLRLSFLLTSCGLIASSCDFAPPPEMNELLKWLIPLPILMQNHSGRVCIMRLNVINHKVD